jgi:putative effector of murein hydrolase
MQPVDDIWVYLSASPLLHLTLTLIAFQIGTWAYRRTKMNPLLNPVLIAVLLVVGALLGPATVALAIPLYRQAARVRRSAPALLASILAGSLTAAASAVGIAWVLGGGRDTLIALAPKSVTAPVAMGITEQLGGLPSLTAVLVILTGVLGAMLGPPLLTVIGVRGWAARGVALGTASHGIGTARALQVREVAGAFAGLAMGLNALATAVLLPLLARLLL